MHRVVSSPYSYHCYLFGLYTHVSAYSSLLSSLSVLHTPAAPVCYKHMILRVSKKLSHEILLHPLYLNAFVWTSAFITRTTVLSTTFPHFFSCNQYHSKVNSPPAHYTLSLLSYFSAVITMIIFFLFTSSLSTFPQASPKPIKAINSQVYFPQNFSIVIHAHIDCCPETLPAQHIITHSLTPPTTHAPNPLSNQFTIKLTLSLSLST